MFTRRAAAGITLGALALATFGAAAPSSADSVTVQFTVSSAGGGLAVASAASAATLSSATTNLVEEASISGSLPEITVTDQRGGTSLTNWKVEVLGTSFVNQTPDVTGIPDIPATASRIYVPVANFAAAATGGVLGGMVVTGGAITGSTSDIGSTYTLLSGTTAPLLTGSVKFTPTMEVVVPAGAALGTYQNTVTYTAS